MRRWGREKKPKASTDPEGTEPAEASKVSKGSDKEVPRTEEDCGLFTLHDLSQDVADALEYVLNSGCLPTTR